MPTFDDKIPQICRIHLLRVIAFAAAVLYAVTAFAADQSETKAAAKQTQDEPIQITADQLISDNNEQWAEFIGNVKAVQADWVITSDKLRIYYAGGLLNSEEKSNTSEQSLKKIVATGNVKIISEQYSADAEMAEYDTQSMTIILSGEDAKLFSGKNSITGSKIILYQKEGRVKVEGSKNKRIKAVFYSEGKASDAFKIEKPQQ
jgi:lipopolysaccharide export system protein LptA